MLLEILERRAITKCDNKCINILSEILNTQFGRIVDNLN